ncbi:MAG: cell division protein FtsX [Desulfurivibrionaceae bacterium]
MRYLSFIFSQTSRNILSSWSMQAMTMLTVALSVLIFSFFYFLYNNMIDSGNQVVKDIKIMAYLDDQPSRAMKDELETRIKKFNPVEKIEFVAPPQAFQELESQLGSEKDILADLDPAFLPYSIKITPKKDLKHLSRIKNFAEYLEGLPSVGKVQYGRGWLERFDQFANLLRLVVILSGALLILNTLFMVSYTIRLTLVARQEELKILRYMGATNSYIKIPILIEGFLLGLVGALTGLGALYLLFGWMQNNFRGEGLLNFFQLSFLPWPHIIGILLAAVLLCSSGSMISIRKLLKI